MDDRDPREETTLWVADSGLFIACGRAQNHKYVALKRFVRRNDIPVVIPRRGREELGGAPDRSTPGKTPIERAIDAGWVTVADELDYANSTVSAVMDDVRSYIAQSSNRPEDRVEKADAALAGVTVQLLLDGDASSVTVVTTDVDAGAATVTVLESRGFTDQVTFRDGFQLIEEIT